MIDGALERGHEAIAVTSTLPLEAPPIPMHRVPSVVLPLQKNYRIALPGYSSFARTLEAFRPDVLHINSPCTLGFAAAKYGQHFGVPVVATYHTHFPTYPRYYGLDRFEELTWKITRSLYNSVDRTFVPTRPILDELVANRIERLEYVPNGVDTALFTTSRRSSEWRNRFGNGEKPIVLFVSRLVWEKDLRVLAEAYRLLREQRQDLEMVVVGDGHARAEFEAMMPGAHFLGFQSGTTLAESFASSDIFVFPSTTETFGLVTLEAMASGLAPVAAKVGGAAGIIEEGVSGLFSVPHCGDSLASQVKVLLDHPEYRTTIARRAHAHAQHFDWNVVLGQLFDSYADVVESHRRPRHRAA
jgi:glycosyltransferase involved in cell wall biosynthesis